MKAPHDRRNSGSDDGKSNSEGTGLVGVELASCEDTESIQSKTNGATLHEENIFEAVQG